VANTEPARSAAPDFGVLRGLAERILGRAGSRVVWQRLPHEPARPGRRFEYDAHDGWLYVRGSDTLAAALGLHDYLKSVIRRRVCWDTVLPLTVTSLPDVDVTTGAARVDDVYYLNFCTFSYTTAYWDWARWQREIDWMALHGVTMPLAAVGHEAILARVYRELGLGEHEIREFLGGPGYLPFQFMGCLDGWAGPLPTAWLAEREALGSKIISRQREYGMTPVLPAFTGHVPASLAGDGTTSRTWWGFPTRLLAPDDPRLRSIAKRVVEVQREIFGTAHLYAADPFIEMRPPSDDPHFLPILAASLVTGLRSGDPDAVWVMQAWTFGYMDFWTDDLIAAFLDAVPDDAMLVLDLWGEHSPQWRRFGGFRGKRWLWCALHNFGGRSDLFGSLRTTREEFEAALLAGEPPAGSGLAMEATEQNPIVYEMTLDLACAPIADLASWVRGFPTQRYGLADPAAASAWDRLRTTLYDAPADRVVPSGTRGCVTTRPTVALVLDERELRTIVDAPHWYDEAELSAAWTDLSEVAERHPDALPGELGHDLVSVAATAISRTCDRLVVDVVRAWPRSSDELVAAGDRLLAALDDLDGLLSTRAEFRLATWERAATAHAHDADEARILLDNARRIVSVWDTIDKLPLTDYSARLWSGLVGGLYRERWRVWVEELIAARTAGRDPDEAVLSRRIGEVTEAFLAGTAG
jgi:alpha-N-acetylglucosaminidase